MLGQKSTIEVDGVAKKYGSKLVLEDVTLKVNSGEIFGLLGPSGAGKTTLVKLLVGIEEPTSGNVVVLGEKMPTLKMMKSIGYMSQSDALYAELTAKENLEFFGGLFGLKGKMLKKRITKVMELVNLQDDLKKIVNQYSGGMKRRLSLAIALLHSPDILILDEPTVGIDPVLRRTIWKELDILSENGMTIIVTTHVMDEAEKCKRLGMIRNGKLIAQGSPKDLIEQVKGSTLEEAFLTYGGVQVEN